MTSFPWYSQVDETLSKNPSSGKTWCLGQSERRVNCIKKKKSWGPLLQLTFLNNKKSNQHFPRKNPNWCNTGCIVNWQKISNPLWITNLSHLARSSEHFSSTLNLVYKEWSLSKEKEDTNVQRTCIQKTDQILARDLQWNLLWLGWGGGRLHGRPWRMVVQQCRINVLLTCKTQATVHRDSTLKTHTHTHFSLILWKLTTHQALSRMIPP